MKKIDKNSKVFYIKLGSGGKWEEECIIQKQYLKIGYKKVDINDCLNDQWEKIHKSYISDGKSESTATRWVNEQQYFFHEDESTLWITFYNNKMWWARAEKKIELLETSHKIRRVVGKWQDTDINNKPLLMDHLSGIITKTQGYRGTICSIKEKPTSYVIDKINGEVSDNVIKAEKAYNTLKEQLKNLIQGLLWQDFEDLIDLIFRHSGYRRISPIGKTQKTYDLNLVSPVTGEKFLVQIKSKSNEKEFKEYYDRFIKMKEYNGFFFLVHTLKIDFVAPDNSNLQILSIDKIAELTVDAGLTSCVITKAM